MHNLFYNTISLTSLDIKDLNTDNVEDMSYMFFGSKISSLNLNNFTTSKVTDMSHMFQNCTYLTYLNITNLIQTKLKICLICFHFYLLYKF